MTKIIIALFLILLPAIGQAETLYECANRVAKFPVAPVVLLGIADYEFSRPNKESFLNPLGKIDADNCTYLAKASFVVGQHIQTKKHYGNVDKKAFKQQLHKGLVAWSGDDKRAQKIMSKIAMYSLLAVESTPPKI